jgi:hypothetical protein
VTVNGQRALFREPGDGGRSAFRGPTGRRPPQLSGDYGARSSQCSAKDVFPEFGTLTVPELPQTAGWPQEVGASAPLQHGSKSHILSGVKAKVPRWSLDRAKELVAQDKLLVMKGRAQAFFGTPGEAFAAAKKTVLDLTTRSFSETKQQTYDKIDIYGVVREGVGWMLKICIDETIPELVVVSFHPLEKGDLRTNGGLVKQAKKTEYKKP